MQLWFARGSEVTIREQLVTQVILAILSDDLAAGQRLPSTRELARRFRLHPNTVSAGYRQLERQLWVELRHGSGVYVRDRKPEAAPTAELALDQLIAKLFSTARELGAPLGRVRSRLRHWLDLQPPDHFLLVEPNEELRQILTAEISQAVAFPVKSCGFDGLPAKPEGAVLAVLPNRAAAVRHAMSEGTDVLTLQVRSVHHSLASWLPAPSGLLIGIASGWPDFLKHARTMLQASGFHPDGLLIRDARRANWERGLRQSTAVVCDVVTASRLPAGCRAIPFPLLSESSITELRHYVEFIKDPLAS
ncbi:MAG TPA: GntR family transcriptional regulator [Terriglobales bacterium]|nr:GntR family transcriptional regulator [Terriglobales bacterium]